MKRGSDLTFDLGILHRTNGTPINDASSTVSVRLARVAGTTAIIGGSHLTDKRTMIKHVPANYPALLQMLHTGFADHYAVQLSPDDLIFPLVLAAGHLERSKHLLVAGGDKKITLSVDKTILSWDETIAAFYGLIEKQIGPEAAKVYSSDFSTTGPAQKLAYTVALMSAYQSKFDFRTFTMCGIPKVTLLGTKEDWTVKFPAKVRQVLAAINSSEIEWIEEWKAALLTDAVDKIVDSVNTGSLVIWNNIYKYNQASGSDTVTGWINLFFPMISTSAFAKTFKQLHGGDWGRSTSDFPSLMVSAPTVHQEFGDPEEQKLTYYAGQLGVHQLPESKELQVVWAWGIAKNKN